ncbi:MAG: hypothetical protein Q9201_003046 [Fulgogasparrea decipioides]
MTSISTRPPTPPKEHPEDSVKLPNGNTYQGTLGQQVLLDTPNESPSSSSECVNGSSGKLPKRVIFSPWTSYHKALYPSGKANIMDVKIRALPPSKDCVALHKSILKVSDERSSPTIDFPKQLILDSNDSVAAMFRSVTQYLANASRALRLDTYKTLLGCLGAYDEVPDTQSLADNLAAFLDYIRRDVSAKQPESGNADTELVTSALKLLSVILYTQGLVEVVPDEFGIFIVERAVSSLESHDVPKVIVDHYMHLLARQKLPQKCINADRANRILTALNKLEARLKGNRVIGLKLMVYQRLLVQAKACMVTRAEEWLEFLIASMSSSIREVRLRAIAFGTEAALTLGTTNTVTQVCLDILDGESPSGMKVVDVVGNRMLEILNLKDEGLHVPQIWSVIILFLRSRRRQIERWGHLKGWLGIMERAFNSSDPKVKLQANVAWNRLILAIDLDTTTSTSVIKLLRQPIASQLERKGSDKHSRHAKQLARSTYCTLLYYSFRPGATYEQLDLYWDSFIGPILSIQPTATASDHDFACEVLAAILSSLQPRVWDQNRANQLSPMKPHELPCLDPKWVRLRAAKVVSLLESLLSHTDPAQRGDARETPFFKAWEGFVKALGDAASKEIKVSMETMTAVAYIISMLFQHLPRRVEQCLPLIKEAVAKIGFRPFLERRLLVSSSGTSFEAAETPSSRSSHPRGRSLNSPVVYLAAFLVHDVQPEMDAVDPIVYREAIQALLTIALRSANSRHAQLAILRQLAVDVLTVRPGEFSNRLTLWECVAQECERALSQPKSKMQDSDSPQRPDQDYHEIFKLLELGLQDFGHEFPQSWSALSNALMTRLRDEVDEIAVSLVITEPLSRVINEASFKHDAATSLRYGSYLISCARWPQSREELERACKRLRGPGSIAQRPASLDPFNHAYSMVQTLLMSTYSTFKYLPLSDLASFVSSVGSFLLSCPPSYRPICVSRMQRGLAVWIEDQDAVVSHSDTALASRSLYSAVRGLWETSLHAVQSVSKHDSAFLALVQDLLAAGFQSRHTNIVNGTVIMWNGTFGKAEISEYPPALRTILTKLRPVVDLELPGFIDDDHMEILSSPFRFVDSQEEETEAGIRVVPATTTGSMVQQPKFSLSSKTSGHQLAAAPSPHVRPSRREREMTPRARLRHDDSQIQFAAIYSSPLAPEVMEPQHITDHQKEVKERQEQGAAAMFPDIRSSPRKLRSVERPPELVLHMRRAPGKPLDADAEPSPTFPPGDATMNEFLGSSPTPRSSRKGSVDRQMKDGPASSPPGTQLPTFQRDPSVTASGPEQYKVPKTSKPPKQLTEQSAKFGHASTAAPKDHGISTSVGGQQCGQSVHGSLAVKAAIRPLEGMTSDLEVNPAFDNDVYVDASANPVENEEIDPKGPEDLETNAMKDMGDHATEAMREPVTPPTVTDRSPDAANGANVVDDDVSRVKDSFPAEAPYTPTEDEQAREQLLRDLEEASSQADSQVPRRRPSLSAPSKPRRKRKTHPPECTKPKKRAKVPPSSQNFEVVVKTRKHEQRDNEGIVVDDRIRSTSPMIKRERSPSPLRNLHLSSVKMAAMEKAHGRRRTRSMTRGSSSRLSKARDSSAASAPPPNMKTDAELRGNDGSEQHPRKRRRTSRHENRAEQPIQSHDRDDLPVPPSRKSQMDPDPETAGISSQMEGIKDLSKGDVANRNQLRSSSSDGDTVPNTPHDPPGQHLSTATTVQEPPARSPGQRILDRFRGLLNDLRQVTLWPQEERDIMEVAFEVVRDVHEAGFRSGGSSRQGRGG